MWYFDARRGIRGCVQGVVCVVVWLCSGVMYGGGAVPLVRNMDRAYEVSRGLEGRNVALWHSHGLYYDQRDDRWKWQRARVMTTVEDKYTMSYVIPYLLPMLERAGASVFVPRERDMQACEAVVDNDSSVFTRGRYSEAVTEVKRGRRGGRETGWSTAGRAGFGLKRAVYTDRQNPFAEGTFRKHDASPRATVSVSWEPRITQSGWYQVSIAYATTERSVPDAHYTVRHAAGETHFAVDQRRGGGTWVYLGEFYFEEGAGAERASVTLDNGSVHEGEITADAVRWGGGVGNIARRPAGEEELALYKGEVPETDRIQCYEKDIYTTSTRARAWEAARYYLQWAGMPYEVYCPSQGMNDYRDDYNCRPLWANRLMYGSEAAPDSTGLGIEIDAAIAFHSDAGTAEDSIIGTMGIYTTRGEGGKRHFPNGKSRKASGRLTEMVVGSVVADIRAQHCPQWTDRRCHDRNYAETRRAEMPTVMIELLSHQNYDDMRYGLDPAFKFTVARAVYKGLARFIAEEKGRECVIAPLPVRAFAINRTEGKDSIVVTWEPSVDTLEASAVPTGYVLYTATEGRGWDNGRWIGETRVTLPFEKGVRKDYRVTAVNQGGESMDSEILSAYRAEGERGTVMIVNGFDRVAAPEGFYSAPYGGFPEWKDHGVAEGEDMSYVGAQNDFDTRHPWVSDDNAGWGQSDCDMEFTPPAGNTRHYPALHGRAIGGCGYSYVSCSHTATDSVTDWSQYAVVDVILGEQRRMYEPTDSGRVRYATFSEKMQEALRRYTRGGGAVLVSGAYVVSDAWLSESAREEDRDFVREVLRVEWRAEKATQDGRVEAVSTPKPIFFGNWFFCQERNQRVYEVENPDALIPADERAVIALRYSQNRSNAAIACDAEGYRTVVCGFPLESIYDEKGLRKIMQQALHYLSTGAAMPITEKP